MLDYIFLITFTPYFKINIYWKAVKIVLLVIYQSQLRWNKIDSDEINRKY